MGAYTLHLLCVCLCSCFLLLSCIVYMLVYIIGYIYVCMHVCVFFIVPPVFDGNDTTVQTKILVTNDLIK